MEEQLRQLIEQAKATNNTVLVEQLNQALNTFLAQQKQQEDIKLKSQENINQEENKTQEVKKEEVIQETKVEDEKQNKIKEEDIQKVNSGEVSKLITTKDGNHILESKYMDIRSSAKNSKLRTDLNSILVTLALDDITNERKATAKLYNIMDTYEDPEDIDDLQMFLDDIAKVGRVGEEAKESIANGYTISGRKEVYDKYFNDEFEKQRKAVDFLDMEFDELHSKPIKDSNQYEEMIDRYNAIIQKLEKLYDETANKVDSEKSQQIEATIQYLKGRITAIKKYCNSMKDISDFVDRSFNSL